MPYRLVLGCLLPALASLATPWATWRGNAQHTAATDDPLPARVRVLWSRDLPRPAPAWSDPRLDVDSAPHPVVAAGRLFVGSTRNGTVSALDAASGAELWRVYLNGPVRATPAVAAGRLYVGADDGTLYCLDAATGREIWRFFGGLSPRLALGNERLISLWPARGGPVVAAGRVYFAAGVWPFMGVPVYALSAEDGARLWANDRAGVVFTNRESDMYTNYWGASPQGSLALAESVLVVPCCRSRPLFLDAGNGEITRADAGWKDYGGGGDARVAAAGPFVLAGGYLYRRDAMLPVALNASPEMLKPFATMPILEGARVIVATDTTVEAHEVVDAPPKRYRGAYGVQLLRSETRPLWQVPFARRATAMIRAGDHVLLGSPGQLTALRVGRGTDATTVAWEVPVAGEVADLAAADGMVFASTREGKLVCLGEGTGDARHWPLPRQPLTPAPSWQEHAGALLACTRSHQGYALVLGIRDGGLAIELLRQSEFNVIVIDNDEVAVRDLRSRLDEAGLLGFRADVLQHDPAAVQLPPYLATLATSECPDRLLSHSAGALPRALLEGVRPCGGVFACLATSDVVRAAALLGTSVAPPEWAVSRVGDLWRCTRQGLPAGAADWEYDAADAGNTWLGADRLVRAPLGVLWFGGPTESSSLYRSRHSDPPTPRVVQGQLFLYGNNTIAAADAYTGRLLWKRALPAVQPVQNRRSFAAGGPFPGVQGDAPPTAWYVAKPDGLYVAYGQSCQIWDPASGIARREFSIPDPEDATRKLFWGDIRVEGDRLIAAAGFGMADTEAAFLPSDVSTCTAADLAGLVQSLPAWPPLSDHPRRDGETAAAYAVRGLNLLLRSDNLDTAVPTALLGASPEQSLQIRTAAAEVARHRERSRTVYTPFLSLASLNRRLLESCYPVLAKVPSKLYWHNLYPWDGMWCQRLCGLDRQSGTVLWQHAARYGFPLKSLATGNGRVFVVDRVDPDVEALLSRRGMPCDSTPAVRAFAAASGEPLWTSTDAVEGYHLMYSAEHDILVRPSAYDPDPAAWSKTARRQSVHLVAQRGRDGARLWDSRLELDRSCGRHRMWYNWFLHRDTVIVESYYDTHAEFYGFDLVTGQPRLRRHPVTEREVPWGFLRRGGCTKNLACENLVLFRSGTAGAFDIANDGGTAHLGGFRPGCKNSLIPAGGIVSAPNYASGCTCNYPVFTALALVPMPEVEWWALNPIATDAAPVRRLGLNFGAPGDRRDAQGTLWLDYPSTGGRSPDLPITVTGRQDLHWVYRHSARLRSHPLNWVGASAGVGIENITVPLRQDPGPAGSAPGHCTVRLYFAEHADARPGDRVFDIRVQGDVVLRGLDVVVAAGGKDRVLVREFAGIAFTTALEVGLVPRAGQPLICGLEVVVE